MLEKKRRKKMTLSAYSVTSDPEDGIFLQHENTTWWSLGLILRGLGVKKSPKVVLTEAGMLNSRVRRFTEFSSLRILLPKKSYPDTMYFLTQEDMVTLFTYAKEGKKPLSRVNREKVEKWLSLVQNPNYSYPIDQTMAFPVKKRSKSPKAGVLLEDQILKQVLGETLEFSKQITLLLDFQRPIGEKESETAYRLWKQLVVFFPPKTRRSSTKEKMN
jgi:hypothetical protein